LQLYRDSLVNLSVGGGGVSKETNDDDLHEARMRDRRERHKLELAELEEVTNTERGAQLAMLGVRISVAKAARLAHQSVASPGLDACTGAKLSFGQARLW
jgi:hypothetical protein